jgi:hypothetical protein
VTPLDIVSAVRHVALYVADRTASGPPRRQVRPASIEIISGGSASARRRSAA